MFWKARYSGPESVVGTRSRSSFDRQRSLEVILLLHLNCEDAMDAYQTPIAMWEEMLANGLRQVDSGTMTREELTSFVQIAARLNPDLAFNVFVNGEQVGAFHGDADADLTEEDWSDDDNVSVYDPIEFGFAEDEPYDDVAQPLTPPPENAPAPTPVSIVIPDDDSDVSEECCICLDDTPGSRVETGCCRQQIHTVCMDDVIQRSRSIDVPCPLCRTTVYRHQA